MVQNFIHVQSRIAQVPSLGLVYVVLYWGSWFTLQLTWSNNKAFVRGLGNPATRDLVTAAGKDYHFVTRGYMKETSVVEVKVKVRVKVKKVRVML